MTAASQFTLDGRDTRVKTYVQTEYDTAKPRALTTVNTRLAGGRMLRHDRDTQALRARLWEINCPVCRRSSWDGTVDDEDADEADRCRCCGQLPAGEGHESRARTEGP